jgi:hypothetical protein
MCGRNDIHVNEEPKDKKKRKMMSVLQKLEVLDRLNNKMKLLWSDSVKNGRHV